MQDDRSATLNRLTLSVVHQFNNVLGVISNSVHLLDDESSQDDRRIARQAIQRCTDTGMRLTRVLLQYTDRPGDTVPWVNLRAILPDLTEALQLLLGSRAKISTRVDAFSLPVRIQAGDLELLLIGMVLEARHLHPSIGEIHVGARNAAGQEPPPRNTGSRHFVRVQLTIGKPVFEETEADRRTRQDRLVPVFQRAQTFCQRNGGQARLNAAGGDFDVEMLLPAGAPASRTTALTHRTG
ncbi:MAG TPA: hypothetical protein PKA20_07415 [Burkholderiaceae bacterium]|nr:hypothetical protein [Burkholderiaceae bacterium]